MLELMKKIFWVLAFAGVAVLASCDGINGKSKELQAQNDSLLTALSQRTAEIDEMMGTFNEITEGFRQINEAENRVDLQTNQMGEGSVDAKARIAQDIEFIKNQMKTNREQIAKLEEQLKNSKYQSTQLRKALEGLNQQLAEKEQHISDLQAELAAKNVRIEELDEAVETLNADKDALVAENVAQENVVNAQDKQLHEAWFVFGTKKELREENILTDGGLFKKDKVMSDSEINKDYFTKIDIRSTKEIKLYSKSAEMLTNHPAGSYSLDKDANEQLVLHITDPDNFWSVSKYLVIQVK